MSETQTTPTDLGILIILSGLPGAGKTTIAIEYILRGQGKPMAVWESQEPLQP